MLWYVNENYQLLQLATETDEEGVSMIMQEQDPATRKELDKTLAAASPKIMERSSQVFEQIPEVIGQAMQMMQQFAEGQQPQIPVDPNQQAETQRQAQADQMRAEGEGRKDETKRIELQGKQEIEFAKLSAEEREQAVDTAREEAKMAMERASRLEELLLQERADDERTAAKLESDERRNTQDNLTALRITAAELEAGDKVNLETGTGINP